MIDLLTTATRCWRLARDQHAPTQQRLHAVLATRREEMLAPVFDSIIRLLEAVLGRPIAVGDLAPSEDERLLAGLLDGSRTYDANIHCSAGLAAALDGAVKSMRIMMAMSPSPSAAASA
ncbi:hypothetical protein [Caulobacter segnis]|uniref:hypothetical protein n=1 Tax=Caulobacter segnis TaxID=88688 RepID=UPI002865C7FD|nr:hypothetical protein [Caulobacter segnis]MDR6623844.1 hypothetical protein [Caulobacter segnis]